MGAKEDSTLKLVADMYEGINENRTGNMGQYWFDDMLWYGPQAAAPCAACTNSTSFIASPSSPPSPTRLPKM